MHTCAGSCVWCLEAGVRASRGHECACVRGGMRFRMEWCVSNGSRGQGLPLSGKGCVPVLRVLQSEQSSRHMAWVGGSQDCVSASASLCLGQVQGAIEAHSCVLENPRDFQGWVFFASLPLPSHVHCGSDCSRPYYLLLGSPSSVLTPGLRLILNLIQLNCFPA